jgi:hypothetical protein
VLELEGEELKRELLELPVYFRWHGPSEVASPREWLWMNSRRSLEYWANDDRINMRFLVGWSDNL